MNATPNARPDRSRPARRTIPFTSFAVALLCALGAREAAATCTPVPQMVSMGFYLASGTNNATTNFTDVGLGSFEAGTTVIVGVTGFSGTPDFGGDTFIRLFDDAGEVATNDDACGTFGSRIVYTVPQGTKNLRAHLGCFSGGSCSGSVFMFMRLDSVGYLSDTVKAFKHMNNVDAAPRTLHDQMFSMGLVPDNFKDAVFDQIHHFQGMQRIRLPTGDFFVMSGSGQADLFFAEIAAAGTFAGHQKWADTYNPAQRSTNQVKSRWQLNTVSGSNLVHQGGVQVAGKYLATVTQPADNDPLHNNFWMFRIHDISVPSVQGPTLPGQRWTQSTGVLSAETDGVLGSDAGYGLCAGITKLRDGAFLTVNGKSDGKRLEFRRMEVDEQSTFLTRQGLSAGWADIETGTFGTRTIATTPSPLDGYNICNLFTNDDGRVFFVDPAINYTTFIVQIDPFTMQRSGNALASKTYPAPQIDLRGSVGVFADTWNDRLYMYAQSRRLNDNGTIDFWEFGGDKEQPLTTRVSSGKCIDDPSNSTASGTRMQIYSCTGGQNQKFFQKYAQGPLQHTQGSVTLCLDVDPSNGVSIRQATCTGAAAQNWTLLPTDQWFNPSTNRCLELPGSNTANGTQLTAAVCASGATNQKWDLQATQ